MIDLKPILYVINHELLKKKDRSLRIAGLYSAFKRLYPGQKELYQKESKRGDLTSAAAIHSHINELIALDPKIEERPFIEKLVHFLYELKGAIEKGQKGIDEAYILQGEAEGFALLHYCYKMEPFRSLVHHLGIYADAWPAKFAIKQILADIEYLLMEYRFFK